MGRRLQAQWFALSPCLGVLGLVSMSASAEASTPVALEATTVQATRLGTSVLDTPASVDVIDGTALRARQPGINLSEGLLGVPGLQLQNRQNYAQDLQLSVRGFGARSSFGVRGVRLYVDGIPGTMPDGQGQTSNIDIASADYVEVLRGPFSSLYGNSSGGVVQVFTENGSTPAELSTDFSGGSYGTSRYALKASGTQDLLDYTISTSHFSTDGYRDHSAARKNLGNAKLGFQLSDSSRLTLIANSVHLTAKDPLGLTRAQFKSSPHSATAQAEQFDTRKTVEQTQGGLIYESDLNEHNELRAMFYYGQRSTIQYQAIPVAAQQARSSAGGVIDLDRDYGGTDVRLTSRLDVANRPLTVVSGLSYDRLTEQRKGYQNYVGGSGTPVLGEKGVLRRDETNRVYNLDPYLQLSFQASPKWVLDAGLRYSTVRFDSNDHYVAPGNQDDSGDAHFRKALPVAAIRYSPTSDTTFYASYGRGFETPTFNELSYRPDGQPGLNFGLSPSLSDNYEIGAKKTVVGGLLTAAVFRSDTEDEIVPATNLGGRTSYRNAGQTRRDGVELAWNGHFAEDASLQLSYALLDARYQETVSTDIHKGRRIPGTARQAAFAALAWEPLEGWQAGIEGRVLSNIAADDANSEKAPGYFVAALSTGYVWLTGPWQIRAYGRVDNLFDRQYAGSVIVNEGNRRYFEPAPGRNWSAGIGATLTY